MLVQSLFEIPEHFEDRVLDLGPVEARILLFKFRYEVVAEHLNVRRNYEATRIGFVKTKNIYAIRIKQVLIHILEKNNQRFVDSGSNHSNTGIIHDGRGQQNKVKRYGEGTNLFKVGVGVVHDGEVFLVDVELVQ